MSDPRLINNKIVVDLKKVQFAYIRWTNRIGITLRDKPTLPTRHGCPFYPDEVAFPPHKDYPGETLLQRAKRLNLELDVWTKQVVLNITANRRLVYSGAKAQSIWDAWNALQFGKKKKKTN